MREYTLYHWVGGFNDRHIEVGRYSTLDEVLKRHIELRPNSPLYNYADLGNDYYEEIEVIEPKKKECVYNAQPKEKRTSKKDPNVEFLETMRDRLLYTLELQMDDFRIKQMVDWEWEDNE